MNKFINIVDRIVSRFWLGFCTLIFVFAVIIKAMYAMEDYPYFKWSSFADLFFIAGAVGGVYLIFHFKEKIEQRINYVVIISFFAVLGIAFVLLVPLKPFSDMQYVVEGALCFARRDLNGILASEYLQFITKNLKVSMFYGIFALILPNTVLSLRIINVALYLIISFFMGKIAANLGFYYPKTIFILTASFLPLLIYCNHVYFDLPALCMCVIAVSFYTAGKDWRNMVCAAFFLGIGSGLRELTYLFAVAMIIDFTFYFQKELFQHHGSKLLLLLVFLCITCGIPQIQNQAVNIFFRAEGAESESIWTQFWMGINEEEFGFMHNEIFDGQKNFTDFYELLISRTAKQNIRLFGRKIFWTWSQGTYQAQRYGFGGDVEHTLDKFEYVTPLTRYLNQDSQKGRRLINMLCRAQYLALFFFMIIGLLGMDQGDRERYRMFIYLMFGTFIILIFYEMKSRYIFHCLLPMMMLAVRGMWKLPLLLWGHKADNEHGNKYDAEKYHKEQIQ